MNRVFPQTQMLRLDVSSPELPQTGTLSASEGCHMSAQGSPWRSAALQDPGLHKAGTPTAWTFLSELCSVVQQPLSHCRGVLAVRALFLLFPGTVLSIHIVHASPRLLTKPAFLSSFMLSVGCYVLVH